MNETKCLMRRRQTYFRNLFANVMYNFSLLYASSEKIICLFNQKNNNVFKQNNTYKKTRKILKHWIIYQTFL